MNSTSAKPLAVLLLILAAGVGITGFILLRQGAPLFQSTAAVRVVRDQTDLVELGDRAPAGLDTAFFLQNEAELVRSDLILQKVIERLDLSHEWGNRFNDGQKFKTSETAQLLKTRSQVAPEPNDSLLRIRVASDTGPEATKLAEALATAYCEYRVARRQRIAQDTIDALAVGYKENEAKVRRAAELVEQARQELDPTVRDQNPPPQPASATEGALPDLRRALARTTMLYMAQSNQLVLSHNLPADELQKLTAQVERTRTALTNSSAAVQGEARKQETLRGYWLARQELEKAEIMFAPYKDTVAAKRSELGALENPPAYIAETASPAKELPAHKATAGKGCLIGAGVLLVAGAGLFFTSRFPGAKT